MEEILKITQDIISQRSLSHITPDSNFQIKKPLSAIIVQGVNITYPTWAFVKITALNQMLCCLLNATFPQGAVYNSPLTRYCSERLDLIFLLLTIQTINTERGWTCSELDLQVCRSKFSKIPIATVSHYSQST